MALLTSWAELVQIPEQEAYFITRERWVMLGFAYLLARVFLEEDEDAIRAWRLLQARIAFETAERIEDMTIPARETIH